MVASGPLSRTDKQDAPGPVGGYPPGCAHGPGRPGTQHPDGGGDSVLKGAPVEALADRVLHARPVGVAARRRPTPILDPVPCLPHDRDVGRLEGSGRRDVEQPGPRAVRVHVREEHLSAALQQRVAALGELCGPGLRSTQRDAARQVHLQQVPGNGLFRDHLTRPDELDPGDRSRCGGHGHDRLAQKSGDTPNKPSPPDVSLRSRRRSSPSADAICPAGRGPCGTAPPTGPGARSAAARSRRTRRRCQDRRGPRPTLRQ